MGAGASIEEYVNNNNKEVSTVSRVKEGLIDIAKRSEKETIDTLASLRDLDAETFECIISSVKFKAQHTKPQYPEVKVSEVPRIENEKKEEFTKKHISTEYIHDYDSSEAKERLKDVEETQFTRWKWACKNITTLVNVFREAGHTDDKIQRMFEGIPFCFEDKKCFEDFCAALKVLCEQIEATTPLKHVGIVITGSSVPGFSQNPMKGFKDLPSKITSTTKSDVDICIYAHGIESWFEKLNTSIEGFEFRKYPSTVGLTESGYRFGIRPHFVRPASEIIADFHEQWHKKKLKGGLQITFQEIRRSIPPWEARLPL